MTLPLYVQLLLSSEDSELLHQCVETILGNETKKYGIRKARLHLTVCHFLDLPFEDYEKVVNDTYAPLDGTKHMLLVTGIAVDQSCVALHVATPQTVPVYPEGKHCHLTMLLEKKPPKYSNVLIHRLRTTGVKDGERLEYFDEPIPIEAQMDLVY